MERVNLVIIGSGPGGYVAAIRAAQKGMSVVCIEKEKTFGGTCLNVGCIPSKALLHSTEYYHRVAHEGERFGIECPEIKFNLDKMMARKNEVVASLTQGIAFLFKKNKVRSIQGEAKLLTPTSVQVADQIIETENILLATGSEPIPLPFLPFDEKRVLSSTGALALKQVPKKLLLVGAGVIGLELGSVYRRLGAEVEVIELLDRVTPGLDRELSQKIYQILQSQGFKFHLGRKVEKGEIDATGVRLQLDQGVCTGDVVLVGIGRRPYTRGLGIEELGIKMEKGRVVIDSQFRTSIPNIYAIGDLVDGPMLAHKASEEGIAAVDTMAGEEVRLNYLTIPSVMYTWPEVASVGLTEEEAKESHLEICMGKIPFKSVPRARCSGDEEGFVKILGEKKSKRVIGLHIIGPNASEMIHEGVLAIGKKMTLSQLGHAAHAHPTCSEAIKEAALAALNEAIHI